MHLVDDAPLVLMLWGTINSLFLTGKDSTKGKRMDRLAAMDMTWKVRMAIGAAVVAIGLILILFPLKFAEFAFSILMPLAVMGFGALTLYNGYRMDQGGKLAKRDMAMGLGIIAFGVALIFLWKYFVLLILLVLALWFFASAFVSIRRSLKGKAAVPEGFWVRMAMAVLSLALGIMTLFVPKATVGVLIILLGVVVLLVGALFLLDGYGLRNAHKLMKEKPELYN
jgi:uncharacterized membrane protein HdeD (DUF308 family)